MEKPGCWEAIKTHAGFINYTGRAFYNGLRGQTANYDNRELGRVAQLDSLFEQKLICSGVYTHWATCACIVHISGERSREHLPDATKRECVRKETAGGLGAAGGGGEIYESDIFNRE